MLTALALPVAAIGQSGSWPSAGNGASDNHYAPGETLLTPASVASLRQRWVFTASGEVPDTPALQGNALYLSDSGGSVWRLNAGTGKPVWQTRLRTITGIAGSSSRVTPAVGTSTVIVGDQSSGAVIALSQANGRLAWRTTLATDQGAMITSAPVVVGSAVYVGVSSRQEGLAATTRNYQPTFRGSVAALDLATGHLLWQTYTVPAGYTGGAVWASNLAVDATRNSVFVSVGNNYSVPAAVAACQTAAKSTAQLDACLPATDHIDSILALNSATGQIRWSQRFTGADTWTVSCIAGSQPPATPCPKPAGTDTDFGSAPNLFSIVQNGSARDLVGAGQKNGVYWALDRDSGAVVWATQVGPGGSRGGIEWGTATDGLRVYVPNANANFVKTALVPYGQTTNGGFWSALDASTGRILWQTATTSPQPPVGTPKPPAGALAEAEGAVSVANGVLYGEDAAGNFVMLDAATGALLKSFQSGSASIAAPAIVAGVLYWGTGYASIGSTNDKLYSYWIGVQ